MNVGVSQLLEGADMMEYMSAGVRPEDKSNKRENGVVSDCFVDKLTLGRTDFDLSPALL